MGKALVGSFLLAAATSLPELLVDLSAIRSNMPDLAVGDLFGSSLINLMILAVADLMHRNPQSMFSRASQAHAISAIMSINVTAVAGMAILLGPTLAPYSIGDIGLPIFAIFAIYVFCVHLIFSNQRYIAYAKSEERKQENHSSALTLFQSVSGFLISGAVLFFAAPFLSHAAGVIANQTGLGTTFVGTTLVALTTSLPELVSTITAVRMGAFDLAIGNIFGSNAFNMILFIPLDLAFQGSLFAVVARTHAVTSFAVIVTTSIAAMGQLYQVEKRKRYVEPDAFVILAVSFGFLFLLYFMK